MEKSFGERVAEAKSVIGAVSPEEARRLSGTEGVTFLDPRPADVIASTTGIIEGALNVSLGDIASGNLPALLSDRSTRVITSCQGGPMGAVAAHELLKQGFSRVSYIEGGTQAWIAAGYPTAR